jgi:SAM-dependent methyltransferase
LLNQISLYKWELIYIVIENYNLKLKIFKMQLKRLPRRIYRLTKSFIFKPIFTFEILSNIFKEKVNGIETYKYVAVTDLNIPIEQKPVHYESSGNSYLGKVLKNLPITVNDTIIDFGCGKGGAVLYMSRFPFKKIIGVEYSQPLYLKAKYNVEKMNKKQIEILHGDAGEYTDYENVNFIYMYNPFGQEVIKQILDNLCKSFYTKPRVIYIISLALRLN